MNIAMRRRSSILGTTVLCTLLLMAARPARAVTETVLYNFGAQSGDSINPQGRLTAHDGNFYGTTYSGGLWGYGSVYELSPNGGGGWNESVIYSFTGGTDGGNPNYAYVVFDGAGNLYGTAFIGGAEGCGFDGLGCGVAFELSPAGSSWTESVVYTFCSQPACTDGSGPVSGLLMDGAGNLYGTTLNNSNGMETVFELSPSGGGWREQAIYNTGYDVAGFAGATMDGAGNIFVVAYSEVFELSPNGKGGWNYTLLHNFPAEGTKDGNSAYGTPALDAAGNVYGTTLYGGKGGVEEGGYGVVYKLSPGKKGKWTEKILHSFEGSPKDGSNPYAGVVLDAAGNLYGTAVYGGKDNIQEGVAYELVAPVGKGSYKEKILWNFYETDGAYPFGSLILEGGNLYGTTLKGGSIGPGVVFELTP